MPATQNIFCGFSTSQTHMKAFFFYKKGLKRSDLCLASKNWELCVVPMSASWTAIYKSRRVKSWDAASHGLLLTDKRRVAHTVPGLDKTLTLKRGTAWSPLSAHVPAFRRSEILASKLTQGSLCFPRKREQDHVATLQNTVNFGWGRLFVSWQNWDPRAWLGDLDLWKNHY